jgi:hypothetical protein
MQFSERIGAKKPKCDLQVESMDKDLRNGLWNILWAFALSKIGTYLRDQERVRSDWEGFVLKLWRDFLKNKVDEIPYHPSKIQESVKFWFLKAQWYEIYDLLEFVAGMEDSIDTNEFKSACNSLLEKELSGYRFGGNEIAPITNKIEVGEIEQAIEVAGEKRLEGVRKHLESALTKLSDRKNPDYRNSIKESISAVESLCKIISKDPKATLGQALKKIEDTVGLHPALKNGFSSIYGYTSDEGGIRHAMIDESTCDFDDAKYMLVSCSAFINYLIMKATKAGLI